MFPADATAVVTFAVTLATFLLPAYFRVTVSPLCTLFIYIKTKQGGKGYAL